MKTHRAWYSSTIETKEEIDSFLKECTNYIKYSVVKPMYRGQADADWMITSKFYRDFSKRFELPSVEDFSQLSKYLDGKRGELEVTYREHHDSLIHDFIKECWHNLGIQITHPKTPALPDTNFYLALAQHYDLPTNLIDVTYSPYIGLFFAFDYDDELDFESEYAALYQTHPYNWQRQMSHIICERTHRYDECRAEWDELTTEYNYYSKELLMPRLSNMVYTYNTRIRNQKGSFFFNKDAIPYDLMMYRMKEQFPYPENPERRILINRSLKPYIVSILNGLNIKSETIYPGTNADPMSAQLQDCVKDLLAKYKDS
ncbi:FRG domain-containing protein [Vibrio harveyi]|uniref:FRG domain-containing protein n=1 Tax=Vibrio harveyi TaxID=669 RepID=UPI002894DA42|nr:FRG domain-containing protein [Vibrio harveyi]